MSKIDRVKEFIGYLKVLLVLLLATNISLISWIANNYEKASDVLLILALIIVLVVSIISILVNKKIIKDIKSLEDL
jgi:membrane protein YdbS with pleckstrin-like domain